MNLVEAINPSDAEYTMLTTYPFDPRFYREYLSRELSDAGVAAPVILMDYDRYQENFEDGVWEPGTLAGNYYLEPVDVQHVFHPKISVSTSEEQIHVAITSANLTLEEITSAAQLGTQYSVAAETVDENPYRTLIQDVLGFVEAINDHYVGRDAGTQLNQLVDAGAWVSESSVDSSPDARFVHNISTPIIEQITDEVGDVRQIQLAAPFFGSPDAVASIVSTLDPSECELLIDDNTHINLKQTIDAVPCPTTVRRLEYDSSRWVHAKFMSLIGEDWSGCLFGSPNQTGTALLKTAATGNLEAGILRLASDPNYFATGPPLYETAEFSLTTSEPVDPDSVTTSDYADFDRRDSDGSSNSKLRLNDVYVETEGEDELHVGLQVKGPTNLKLQETSAVLVRLEGQQGVTVSWSDSEKAATDIEDNKNTIVGAARVPLSWKGAIVRIQVDNSWISNYRQLTTEPTPYSTESDTMRSSGGRHGTQDLIWNLIFKNDPLAGESLSRTANDIQSRIEDADRVTSDVPDDDDTNENDDDDWSIGSGGDRGGGGGASQSAHKQLADSLELSLTNLRYIVEQDPDPENAEAVVDHLENYWRGVEAGFLRAILSDQLSEEEDAILEFDDDKLVSVAQEHLEPLHTEQLLESIGTYLQESLAKSDSAHGDYLDGKRAFDCLFVHPAIVLGLDSATAKHGIHPYNFVEDVFTTLSVSQPIIAENLLDPNAVTERYEDLLNDYREGLQVLEETYECVLSLPDRLQNSHALLLYVVWYQEIDRKERTPPLFEKAGASDRYRHADLEALGELMLTGRGVLDQYEKLSEFRSGSLRDIAQDIFGNSSSDDPEQQIESVARGEYWTKPDD